MGSRDKIFKDSFIDYMLSAIDSSQYNCKVESSIAESCGDFGWAACRACFSGMRSVKECLATLFCPKPDERFEVFLYDSRSSTDVSELTVPLMSECGRDSEDPETDKDCCNEEPGVTILSADSIFGGGEPPELGSLPPLPPPPLPPMPPSTPRSRPSTPPPASVAYDSIPEYDISLSSSDSEGSQ